MLTASVFADDYLLVRLLTGEEEKLPIDTDRDSLVISEQSFSIAGREFAFDQVEYISFLHEQEETDDIVPPAEDTEDNIVRVSWMTDAAPVVVSTSADVTVEVEGTDVTVTNSNTDTEFTYILEGQSEHASFTLESDYKSTIRLNGVTLSSAKGEAINIQCGKRVSLILAEETVNTLTDAPEDYGQKATLYCKGHLEIEGGGELNLTANVNHAISTKEYCQIKKDAGTINILRAANDGIHAKQYF